MDLKSYSRWFDYSRARDTMFAMTDTEFAPWHVAVSNDKKRARLNAMRHFLSQFEYDGKDHAVVGQVDPLIVQRARDTVGD